MKSFNSLKHLIFIPVFFLLTSFLYAQELEKPTWLLMEQGRKAFETGEFGNASRIFREIIDREQISPDAEVWLGRIFEQEGEFVLAEKQYLRALEHKADLYIVEEQFDILYSLSEIYRKTDQYGKYEKTLLSIIEDDEEHRDNLNLQYSMLDVLKDRGIDKMFELYRYENNKYNRARTELGVFYYRTGRYNDAEINLILPLVSASTTGFNFIYDKTANYEYTTILRHIKEMQNYSELEDFLKQNNYFQTLYYLAASLYADGFQDTAEAIWNIVIACDEQGSTWRIRSTRQLQSPFIEPIISNRS